MAARVGRQSSGGLRRGGYKAYKAAFEKLSAPRRSRRSPNRSARAVGRHGSEGRLPGDARHQRPDGERMFETSPMRQYASTADHRHRRARGDCRYRRSVGSAGCRSSARARRRRRRTCRCPGASRSRGVLAAGGDAEAARGREHRRRAWLAKKVGDKIGRGFNTRVRDGQRRRQAARLRVLYHGGDGGRVARLGHVRARGDRHVGSSAPTRTASTS
jgi:hypothetical protein